MMDNYTNGELIDFLYKHTHDIPLFEGMTEREIREHYKSKDRSFLVTLTAGINRDLLDSWTQLGHKA